MSQPLTLVPYTSLCRVSITPISDLEVDERFRHLHRPSYPRILWENNLCVVTCASHDIALTFMDTFRRSPGQELDWYLDEGEGIDPATLPHPYTLTYEEEGQGGEEWGDEGWGEEGWGGDEPTGDDCEDHHDLCPHCNTDYIDPWGRCEFCREMHRGVWPARRVNYRWF